MVSRPSSLGGGAKHCYSPFQGDVIRLEERQVIARPDLRPHGKGARFQPTACLTDSRDSLPWNMAPKTHGTRSAADAGAGAVAGQREWARRAWRVSQSGPMAVGQGPCVSLHEEE